MTLLTSLEREVRTIQVNTYVPNSSGRRCVGCAMCSSYLLLVWFMVPVPAYLVPPVYVSVSVPHPYSTPLQKLS